MSVAGRFILVFRSSPDLRAAELTHLLTLMRVGFGFENWISDLKEIPTTVHGIQSLLAASVDPKLPEAGAQLVAASSDQRILLMAVTGSSRQDARVNIDLTAVESLPDLSVFKQAIRECRPREAYIGIDGNETMLNSYERRQYLVKMKSERPSILRWFHYMDKRTADTVGGIDHCLLTPAARVEQFCDGVLIQLTEELFDAHNPRHQEIQLRAMRHLGIE